MLHDLGYSSGEKRGAEVPADAFGFLAVMAFGLPMFVAKWARYGGAPSCGAAPRRYREAQSRVPADLAICANWLGAWRTIEKTRRGSGLRNA